MGIHFIDSSLVKDFTETFEKFYGEPRNVKDGVYNNHIEDITSFDGLNEFIKTIFPLEDRSIISESEFKNFVKEIFNPDDLQYSGYNDARSSYILFTGKVFRSLEDLAEKGDKDRVAVTLLFAAGYALVRTGYVSYRVKHTVETVNSVIVRILIDIFKELVLNQRSRYSYIKHLADARYLLVNRLPIGTRISLMELISKVVVKERYDEEETSQQTSTLNNFISFIESMDFISDSNEVDEISRKLVYGLSKYVDDNVFWNKDINTYLIDSEYLNEKLNTEDLIDIKAAVLGFIAATNRLGSLRWSNRDNKVFLINAVSRYIESFNKEKAIIAE